MNEFSVWIKASRLPAQTFIFPALLLGQGIYYSLYNQLNWSLFFLIHAYGIFMHLFIVYANDYADYETDLLNTTWTPFTGGSRILVTGNLKRQQLLTAAIIMAILCLISGVLLSLLAGNFLVLIFVVTGLLLLHSYSYRPVLLSYRGMGELLQMAGVGIALPLIGFIAQGGILREVPFLMIITLLPAQLAMAVSTSLPDEPSDRRSSKKTTAVLLGITGAKFLIALLYLITLSGLLFFGLIPSSLNGKIFASLMMFLILTQIAISLFFKTEPGDKAMTVFVFFAILTNTLFVIGVTVFLFG